MFAGVLDCLDLPETEVVYRELRGDEWYRLTRGPDGVQTEPFDVPLDVTDDIPVEALVGCQWKPANGTWTTEKPHHLRVADLVRQARAHNWNWQEAFKACNLPSQDQLGVLFERFVAASLLALGIKQVARNCRLWVGDKTLLEVDLVANHGGRLLIIDCKLRRREDKRVEGITSQIRQAAEIRRRLGGLAAELLLLRPGMTLSEEERQIAESHGLKVLDASCTLQFFQHLWTFVGGTGGLPKEAAEAQAYLDVAAKEGDLEALAGSIRGPLGDSPVPIRTILDFDAILNDVRNFVALQGQDWVVYKLQGAYVLCGYTEEKLSPQDLKAMVSKHFAIAKIKQIQRSNTGLSFWTTLEIPTKDDIEKLHDLLRSYTGKRLFRT
ncbi:MAG: hypothetical protein NZM31_08845 [Gemmatales bacterium]|nr:hypothetical protein [Gemmatales bacterium]MDW8387100.1 hypothetical protein [Gemmatales bacterium]